MARREPWQSDDDEGEIDDMAEFLERITERFEVSHDPLSAELQRLGLDPDDLPEVDPDIRPDTFESYHCALELSQLADKIANDVKHRRPASADVLIRASHRILFKIARAAPSRFDKSNAFAKNRVRALGAARAVRRILKSFHVDDPADAQVVAGLELVERVMELIRNDARVPTSGAGR
jgi:hypothetical protein